MLSGLLAAHPLLAQLWPFPGPGRLGLGPIQLDGNAHGATDNGATVASTVVVTLGAIPTAGSTIICEWTIDQTATASGVSDDVNGMYAMAEFPRFTAGTPKRGLHYFEGAAASAPTITLSYAPAAANGAMSCQSFRNVARYGYDAVMYQRNSTTGTNPTTGSALTPTNNNELIIGWLNTNGVTTPTAGANYTIIDANTTSFLWPEYWIQTTKTATNAPYVSASSTYTDQQVAFAKNIGGFCDSSIIADWSGGTHGNTITVATLGTGVGPTPVYPGTYGNGFWTLTGSGTGITFDSAQAGALSTSETCPTFTGVGAGTLGLTYVTSAGTGRAANLNLGNVAASTPGLGAAYTTAAICFVSHIPNSVTAGTNDPFSINTNNGTGHDYAALNLNYAAGAWSFRLETLGTPSGYVPMTPETKYWLLMKYHHSTGATTHSFRWWTCPNQVQGQSCGAIAVGTSPTGSLTAAGVTNNLAPGSIMIGASAMTTVTGYGWSYCSPLKVDYVHGADLLP